MPRPLPPLNALRAFEASFRHNSFTNAAEELCVTSGAVSQQVRQLEAWFNLRLFERIPGGLRPTPAAQTLHPVVADAFSSIRETCGQLMGEPQRLRLWVSPTLAVRWLLQRLIAFQQQFPEVQLQVETVFMHHDLDSRRFDVALVFGDGDWPEFDVTLLREERLSPVCSPMLISDSDHVDLAELNQHTLLHTNPDRNAWCSWLEAAGLQGQVDLAGGTRFESMELAVSAACSGYGIVMADLDLYADEINNGRLQRLSSLEVKGDSAYYLICPSHISQRPVTRALIDILLQQAIE